MVFIDFSLGFSNFSMVFIDFSMVFIDFELFTELSMYICIYNPPWKNLYKIDHLGVRFYRDEAGRPVFTIEWYLDCAHPVYIPKRDTKLEALQTQCSIL